MNIVGFVLLALLSVVLLFAIAKLMGHKQLAQMDFFDYISGITIGSIAAELAAESDTPVRPLVALIVYGAIAVVLSIITHKFPRARKYINGTPTIIINSGKLYRQNLKKAKLDLSELMLLCREQGYFHLQDIQTAVFEHNGKLSILPVSTARPTTPADLQLQPPPEQIDTEVIMDGRVMGENLQRLGLDRNWLDKQLRKNGYKSADHIFLAVCDSNHELLIFPVS